MYERVTRRIKSLSFASTRALAFKMQLGSQSEVSVRDCMGGRGAAPANTSTVFHLGSRICGQTRFPAPENKYELMFPLKWGVWMPYGFRIV